MTTRQDAWSEEEDLKLAEIVLRYIKEGKTQLEAFTEVGHILSRTPAACGFRWNATVRKQFDEEVRKAKEERKAKKRHLQTSLVNSLSLPLTGQNGETIDEAIAILERMKLEMDHKASKVEDEKELAHLKVENEQLKNEIRRFRLAWQEMGKVWHWAIKEGKEKDDLPKEVS